MSKKLMTTAKELAWKAFCDGIKFVNPDYKVALRERFENWWSENYGNVDATNFRPEHNIYVENRRYIQAE
jgi:hypothetical protein